MKYPTDLIKEDHLRVFEDRSEYYTTSSPVLVFEEGIVSAGAKQRIKKIKDSFSGGFLERIIDEVSNGDTQPNLECVPLDTQKNLRGLVEMVTSEVGRALIGLTIMQLCIKSIEPLQNIRLHKASASSSSFSWKEGISMRTLDKEYVTPILRKKRLVSLNADGFMMTRSLAENYPYSALYKAKLRGARTEWLSIVEQLESGAADPCESLKFFLSLLINAAEDFEKVAGLAVETMHSNLSRLSNKSSVLNIIKHHTDTSEYSARLLEIAMHSLFQASVPAGCFGDITLKPLSQMRSANKKHGNIGDIELLENGEIIESWDAKYGKSYLREEIEEVVEKIPKHEQVSVVGFVTNTKIERPAELHKRIRELEDLYDIDFRICTFDDWVDHVYDRCAQSTMIAEDVLSSEWLRAYVETLAQRRRKDAPIDEPCLEWILSLQPLLGAA